MGGIYENQFVKVNGVWQFQHDQVYNTYFIPYDQGWKDLQATSAAGSLRDQSSGPATVSALRDVSAAHHHAAVSLQQSGYRQADADSSAAALKRGRPSQLTPAVAPNRSPTADRAGAA